MIWKKCILNSFNIPSKYYLLISENNNLIVSPEFEEWQAQKPGMIASIKLSEMKSMEYEEKVI